MTARDELARELGGMLPDWTTVDGTFGINLPALAESVEAAGWRKMPSRMEIAEAVERTNGFTVQFWSLTVADAVLALMDGDKE